MSTSQQQQEQLTLQPSALNSADSARLQIASPADSPDKDSPKTSVMKLRGQINDMKDTKTGNAKGHTERMEAMSEQNLAKRDARQSAMLRCAVTAMRIANEAEIVEMRRQGAEGHAEHKAWMHRLGTQNAQKMEKLKSDGARNLKAMKVQDLRDELRHKKEFAEMNAAHAVDMASTEQKHQSELAQSRQNRGSDLRRHNHEMAAMGVQHTLETDNQKQRQRNEVDAQGRANDAEAATQTANMMALKGKNQTAMDEMCRLMRATEKLETAVDASRERFFVLADKVNDQSTVLCSHAELQKSTATLLSTQMEYLRRVHTQINVARKKRSEADQTTGSLKELQKRLKVIRGERESLRRRVSRQMNVFAKVNDKLLGTHARLLD